MSNEIRPGQSEVRLTAALEEYLAALDAGGAPAEEAFLARHPDLAEELRPCLASLGFIRRAGPGVPRAEERGVGDTGPGMLGDFRIIREVGRGGMGVVY